MANNFALGVGQAHEMEMAMNRVGGWTAALVKMLSTGSNLADVRDMLLGRAEIVGPTTWLIDLLSPPLCPEGAKVEEHQTGNPVKWTEGFVGLYLSDAQRGGCILGRELRKELKGKPVLNANALDFLLKHPLLIPEEWEGEFKQVFFWGTIYRVLLTGDLYVRCLKWSKLSGKWYESDRQLDCGFCGNDAAAVATSTK